MAQALKFLWSVLHMPNRRSARLMNRRRAPTPEPVEPNGGHGGNNRGRGGIPFNLENTLPPVEENILPPPPSNLAEVMAQQTQLLIDLVRR